MLNNRKVFGKKIDFLLFISPLVMISLPRFVNILLGISYNIDLVKIFSLLLFFIIFNAWLMTRKISITKTDLVYIVFLLGLILSITRSPNALLSLAYLISDIMIIYAFYFYGKSLRYSFFSYKYLSKFIFYFSIFAFTSAIIENQTNINPFVDLMILTGSNIGDNIKNLSKDLGFVPSLWLGFSLDAAQIMFSLLFLSLIKYYTTKNNAYILSTLLIGITILLIQSKGVILIVAFLFIIMIYSRYNSLVLSYKKIILLPLVLSVGFVIAYITFNLFQDFASTLLNDNQYTSIATRIYGFTVSFQMITDNPIGFGYGAVTKSSIAGMLDLNSIYYKGIRFDFIYPLALAVESSIITALSFLFFLFLIILNSRRLYKMYPSKANKILLLYIILYPFVLFTTTANFSLMLYLFIIANREQIMKGNR